MGAERQRIWSNGTEFMIWEANNCDRCVKADVCDINQAISLAYLDDGTFSPEMVERLGYTGEQKFWCTELQTEGTPEPPPAAAEMARAGAPGLWDGEGTS